MVIWEVTVNDNTLLAVKDADVADRIVKLLSGRGGLYDTLGAVALRDARGPRKEVHATVGKRSKRARAEVAEEGGTSGGDK